ncbi:MAG: hypothetical protein LBQ54_10610 [Planctomycetaceae bacterium]|jgi:transposase|nr:hypothetical protein [Planctomycetaceae bacterium]
MKAIPTEMRRRILQDCDNGMTEHQAAQKGMVGCSTIATVFFDFGKKQRCETGSIEPIQPKTGPKQKHAEHSELLRQIVEATPDATLAEIRDQLPVHVSLPTVFKELRNLKRTYKKTVEHGGTRTVHFMEANRTK